MNITTTARSLALLLAVSVLCAAAAAAQDADDFPIRLDGPAWTSATRGSYLIRPCRTTRGLGLCLGGDGVTAPEPMSKLTGFTRLAGMFMGRVDALSFGGMAFRFKLDIL